MAVILFWLLCGNFHWSVQLSMACDWAMTINIKPYFSLYVRKIDIQFPRVFPWSISDVYSSNIFICFLLMRKNMSLPPISLYAWIFFAASEKYLIWSIPLLLITWQSKAQSSVLTLFYSDMPDRTVWVDGEKNVHGAQPHTLTPNISRTSVTRHCILHVTDNCTRLFRFRTNKRPP